MKKQKIAFIINPNSGNKKKYGIKSKILKKLDQNIFEPYFFYTKYKGHANEIAHKCIIENYNLIIAVGGDGTVNEIGNAIIGSSVIMGIIPTGSGNGLARSLKIPLNITEASATINKGNTLIIDSGKINNRYFFCTCGIGFDARIGKKFNKTKGRGLKNYFRTIIKELNSYKPKKYKIIIDDQKIVKKAFLITFANSSQYGNNAYIAPNAKIDDGFLDVCFLKPFPLIKALPLSIMLLNRQIDKSSYYEVIRARSVQLKRKKKKFQFHLDGEPVKFSRKVRIDIQPKSLKLIVPS